MKNKEKNFIDPLVYWVGAFCVKSEIFYKTVDLPHTMHGSDMIYCSDCILKAKKVRFTNRCLSNYHYGRLNNSSHDKIDNKWFDEETLALKYWLLNNKNHIFDNLIYKYLLNWHTKVLLPYLIQHNVRIKKPLKLTNKNVCVFARPFFWIYYKFRILLLHKPLSIIFK